MYGPLLSRQKYLYPPQIVAQNLLGQILVHRSSEGLTAGMIVETEAYGGEFDDASHAFMNRRTRRTEAMFALGGMSYVYLIYGMYFCFNVVTGEQGVAEAVLIRSIEPLSGIDLMCVRRKKEIQSKKEKEQLCSGPGKLCQAMGINKSHNSVNLCGNTLYICENPDLRSFRIVARPRINVDYALRAKDYLLRFYIDRHPSVSRV